MIYSRHIAERNAIYSAANMGTSTYGCYLYFNYNPFHICPDCARAIIQSGIVCVTGPDIPIITPENQAKWEDDFTITKQMFLESGVNIHVIKKL